eukprot:CAMPEP_0172589022 /NCGR_PEP_ID=MMETSP1068-20121228/7837_1 /TAXON_ID=35684 /ORGANISM="Pseudopedinella elastica, Strain CCMP716" /LENGTH=204 /DNA_ID=CAMNT_0013384525 /DNA_START=742 /DNA_END=1353 /DNA_ORIENTATION=-
MAILVACALTAGCSAVNASLLRSGCMGLHAQNVVLYTLGAASNLVLFWLRLTPSSHISFFSGYREHPLAIALLLSNAFVGILITFVYRFGNAVVKTLATNVSSAVLLLLPFLAPGALWGAAEAGSGAALRTVCGCGVVLVAAVIYLENPPLESSRISESAGQGQASKGVRSIMALGSVYGSKGFGGVMARPTSFGYLTGGVYLR